jgi:hypothetical protein
VAYERMYAIICIVLTLLFIIVSINLFLQGKSIKNFPNTPQKKNKKREKSTGGEKKRRGARFSGEEKNVDGLASRRTSFLAARAGVLLS